MSWPGTISGIFKLTEPSIELPFTGERLTKSIRGQIEFEHLHRYCLARDFCYQLDVLDVASGEGYGSALLATVAKSVKSVEIDGKALVHSKSVYKADNLEFLRGDALELPLVDSSIDVVVSFETLEHIQDQPRFIAEVKRVLRPGGLFIVSTPDRDVYSAQHFNPFHKLELSKDDFRSLLRSKFNNVGIVTQRAIFGSLIAASNGQKWRSYERRHPEYIESSDGLSRATYLVGFAADADLPPLPSSAYFDLQTPWEAAGALQRAAELDLECARARAALEETKARATDLALQRDELQNALADANLRAAESTREKDIYKESLVWERSHASEQLEELRRSLERATQRDESGVTREIAGLIKKDPIKSIPAELMALRSRLPGRRKRYNNILREYEIITRSPLFDSAWYLSVNKDVRDCNMDPALHYVVYGAKEGRAPGPRFDAAKYLEANPDVLQAKLNPLVHYITVGLIESRPLAKTDSTSSNKTV